MRLEGSGRGGGGGRAGGAHYSPVQHALATAQRRMALASELSAPTVKTRCPCTLLTSPVVERSRGSPFLPVCEVHAVRDAAAPVKSSTLPAAYLRR